MRAALVLVSPGGEVVAISIEDDDGLPAGVVDKDPSRESRPPHVLFQSSGRPGASPLVNDLVGAGSAAIRVAVFWFMHKKLLIIRSEQKRWHGTAHGKSDAVKRFESVVFTEYFPVATNGR